MKKKFILLSSLLVIFAASCSGQNKITIKGDKTTDTGVDNGINDYNERGQNQELFRNKEFGKLFYKTEDYMGGPTEERIIYFLENRYLHQNFDINRDREEIFTSTFTDEQKTTFIDAIFDAGLLGIGKQYKNSNIVDGGGWELHISFTDGTDFYSAGENAGPYDVFDACAVPFYELCGEEVFTLPEYYLEPPMIDINFSYQKSGGTYSNNALFNVEKGNYNWNNRSLKIDYYTLNSNNYYKNRATENKSYTVEFSTNNYRYSKKFNSFKVIEYDYDINLSNPNVLNDIGWFKTAGSTLKIDKIYVFKMGYDNGNFVEYSFCTKLNAQ